MPIVALIRSGCTEFDEQQRIQGSLDLPLSSLGEQQIVEICEQLQNVKLEKIYSGPSEPAKGTAEAISASLNVSCKESDGLRNLNQGLWQGLEVEEVRRKFTKAFKHWQSSPETTCPPEGELLSDAVDRVRKALHKPLKKKAPVAVVASEPLATIISCVVGSREIVPGPVCGSLGENLVEFFHLDELPSAGPEPNPKQQEKDTPTVHETA